MSHLSGAQRLLRRLIPELFLAYGLLAVAGGIVFLVVTALVTAPLAVAGCTVVFLSGLAAPAVLTRLAPYTRLQHLISALSGRTAYH